MNFTLEKPLCKRKSSFLAFQHVFYQKHKVLKLGLGFSLNNSNSSDDDLLKLI
jgi:hypothetical protein